MAAARVLVVDDEPAVLALCQAVLAEEGYDVISASSGEEALHIIDKNTPFDMVLSDIVMPGTGGPVLLETVREVSPSTALMLMSGYSPDPPQRGITVLAKPFTPKTLADAVRDCLAAAQIARGNLIKECERSRRLLQEAKQIVNQTEEFIAEARRISRPRKLKPPNGE